MARFPPVPACPIRITKPLKIRGNQIFGQRAEENMSNKTSHDSDVSFIQSLAELLRANDLTELQVKRDYGENNSLNVRVSRQTQVVTQVTAPVAAAAAPVAAAAAPAAAAVSDDPASHPGAVTSPMVGTIYMSAEPGAPAFSAVGTAVKEGDTLLIIEAMKTMNHIPAPKSGTIKRIMVEDGAPVEYGAPLMIIE
jgi:acetyl-CoA carboxylase biotin carboxyl carrier protein